MWVKIPDCPAAVSSFKHLWQACPLPIPDKSMALHYSNSKACGAGNRWEGARGRNEVRRPALMKKAPTTLEDRAADKPYIVGNNRHADLRNVAIMACCHTQTITVRVLLYKFLAESLAVRSGFLVGTYMSRQLHSKQMLKTLAIVCNFAVCIYKHAKNIYNV